MNCDKTLRDIWSNTDREYIDAMQESRKLSNNSKESNETFSFNDWCNAQENKNETILEYDMNNSFCSLQIPDRLKLRDHISSHYAEINVKDNASLESIWAPTIKDKFIKTDYPNNPLSTLQYSKQEAPDPKKSIPNKENVSYESASASDSESELSNNCGSQESLDELNEETFGKFAAIPEEFRPNEADLSKLSDATLLWDMNLKKSNSTTDSSFIQQPVSDVPNTNCPSKKITNKEKSSAQYTTSKTFRKRHKPHSDFNFSSKPAQQNRSFHSKFRSNHIVEKEIYNSVRRGNNSSNALYTQFSNLTIDYETLNPKQNKQTHVTRESNRIKKSSNFLKYRQVSPKANFKETVAIETLRTQRITYVQGKVIDKASDARNNRQDKIKWDSNISLSASEKEAPIVRDNSSYRCKTTGQNNKIQWSSSVDKHIPSSHTNSDYGNNHIKNNGGARPKNLNSYKKYNSYSNAEPSKKDSKILPKNHLSRQENYSFSHLTNDLNKGLFSEVNRNETYTSNFPDKHKCDRLEKQGNKLIHSESTTKESSENRLSWNYIYSDNNEEQNTPKPCSSESKSPKNEVIQNNIIINKNQDYGTTTVKDKFLFSRLNDNHLTTPKVENLQYENNFLGDKTNKLISSTKNKLLPSNELKVDDERKKSELIKYGKDMGDFIVGCERALSMFQSVYNEWVANRNRSVSILEQIVDAINGSSKRSQTIKNILSAINIAADIGNVVSPNKSVSVGLRLTTAIAGALEKLIGNGMSKKDLEAKEFEIKGIFQEDMDTSSLVYIYGMQCYTQFQETCSLISKFHESIQTENFASVTDDEDVIEFLNEISEYNPSNFIVFYKRLKLGYEKLILSSKSKESKAFCRVFEDVPEAVNIINLLHWKFETDGFDHTVLQPYWQGLFDFLYDSECKNVNEFLRKVQECLYFLKKERSILARYVLDLFKEENFGKQKV